MRARIEYPLLLSQLWCMVALIVEVNFWPTTLAALWFILTLYDAWAEIQANREAHHD